MMAVVLAAGEGTRMWPLTHARPKVMLPIANKPILEHLILEAKQAGVQEFVLVVGYHGETVREHFGAGDALGVRIEYAAQRKQQGTAHALQMVQHLVPDRFLLLNGDVLVKAEDVRGLWARPGITVGIVEREDVRDLGTVEVKGERVVMIHEKVENPPTNLANTGVYLLTADIFPALTRTPKSPRGEYELTASLQLLIEEGHPVEWQRLGYWLDVSYPWDLLTANQALMESMEPHNAAEVEDFVVLKGPVTAEEGTVIRSHTYIEGPVVIGKGCRIGPNAYIRPSTAIGDGCHIGASVEVKNSIIMRGTAVPHHNYVGDSVIGEGCNLGAGTKIANLRLDKEEIRLLNRSTGRRKLGAIIGDGVQTGINASINVGSLIGDHCFIGPGALASGLILPNSRIL